MKYWFSLCVLLSGSLLNSVFAQTFCDLTGNVIIYSNYEGGHLNIDVDQNIPNLKVGICTYEGVEVNFSGAYVGNITEVIYAGFGGLNNALCGANIPNVAINGVSPSIVTSYSTTGGNIALTTYLGDPFPYINIPLVNCMVGAEGCTQSTGTGGGNSSPQIVNFFLTEFGAGSVVYYHWTSYSCFFSATYYVSDGGNCCLQIPTGQPNPLYQGGSNYNFLPSDTMLCSDSIMLDVSFYQVLYQPPIYSGYVWSTGDTGTSIVVTDPGVYSFYVSDYCHNSGSYFLTDTIVVLPCCVSFAGSLTTTSVLCEGDSNGSATVLTGSADTIMWNTQPVVFGDSIFNLPAGTYSVLVSDTVGCDTTINFVITEPLPLNVAITGDDSICTGNSIALIADGIGGTSPYNFSWSTGSNNDTLTDSPLLTTVYAVTVTDSNFCTSDTLITLTVVQKPVAVFDPPLAGCEDFEAIFQNQSQNAVSFLWDLDVTTSDEVAPECLYTQPGSYDVTLIASAYGCEDTLTKLDFVTVYPLPQAAFELNYIPGSAEVTFIDASTGPDSCVIDFGDSTMVTACPPDQVDHSYAKQGTYTVILTSYSPEGCVDTATKQITIILAEAVLFPDAFTPNDDGLNDFFLPVVNADLDNYHLGVYNRWGQLIFDTEDLEEGWNGTFKSRAEETGTYVWLSTYRKTNDVQTYQLKGWVMLIR